MGLWPNRAQLWAAVACYGLGSRPPIRRRLEAWHQACLHGVMAVWHARCGAMDTWMRAHGVERWMRRAGVRQLAELQQAVDAELRRRGVRHGVRDPLPETPPATPVAHSPDTTAADAVVAAHVAAVAQMIRHERRQVEAALAAAGAAQRARERRERQSQAMQRPSWRRASPSTQRFRQQRRQQRQQSPAARGGDGAGMARDVHSQDTGRAASSPGSQSSMTSPSRIRRAVERLQRGARALIRLQWSDWAEYARRLWRRETTTTTASMTAAATTQPADVDGRTVRPP